MKALAATAIALLLSGCALAEDLGDVPQPGDRLGLSVAPGVDREAVDEALDAWRARSGGMVDVEVRDGDADARLSLGDRDEYSRPGRWMTVAPDGREGTRSSVEHMVGRMLGIELHPGSGVLATPAFSREWTDEDQVACRSAGWCPEVR